MDGTAGEVDLAALVARPDAGVFTTLRDPAVFELVAVVDGAVIWPDGQDLAPDAMHDEIVRNGRWVILRRSSELNLRVAPGAPRASAAPREQGVSHQPAPAIAGH
jgi:hypothetical protein